MALLPSFAEHANPAASLADLIKAALADEDGIALDQAVASLPGRRAGRRQIAKVQAAHLTYERPWWVAPHLAGSGEARIFRGYRWDKDVCAVPAEGNAVGRSTRPGSSALNRASRWC